MNNKIKLFFIATLTMLLSAHTLVPHHHHYDSYSSHNCSHPIDIDHDKDQSDIPDYHCHAFNNIVDNGYQDKLTRLIKHQPLFIQPFTQIIEPQLNYIIYFREIPDFEKLSQKYGSFYSLRGPPALS